MLKLIVLLLLLFPFANRAFGGMLCAPASEISVTYESQGRQITDRKIFRDDSSGAQSAITQYQSYVASFASNKVIKVSRSSLITCSTATSRIESTLRAASSTPELTLTITNGATTCRTSYPTQRTVMVECEDGSMAVYNKDQDSVYVRPAAQEIYDDMYRQTQAMNALMNQAELLGRADWKKGSQSVTVNGADFEKVLDSVKAEAQGVKFPKPEELTKNFKNFKLTPLNDAMERTYRQQQDRLQRFAKVNNSFTMNPGQIQSYFERFVQGLEKLDDLSQKNSTVTTNEATYMVGNFMNDLVVTGHGSPFSAERRAAAQAVLDSFAPNGVIARPQNSELNRALSESRFTTSLNDQDLSRREYAAQVRTLFNELSQIAAFGSKTRGSDYAAAMSWVADADALLASNGSELTQVQGERLLDQAELFANFERGERPNPLQLSSSEIAVFNFSPNTNTFSGYVLGGVIKELSAAFGSQKDSYLYFHSSIAIKQAQKEALYGNLSAFNAFVQSAYSVVDFAQGFGEGIISVAINGAEGAFQLISHPIDSSIAIFTAITNLDSTRTIIVDAIRAKAAESISWSPQQAGAFQAELVSLIVSSAYSAGHIVGPTTVAKVTEKLSGVGSSINFLPSMKGYLRLKSAYPRIDSAIPELTAMGPMALEPFAEASEQFMGVLGRKLESKELTVGMASHIASFKNGVIRIIDANDLAFYPPGSTLKSARGTSDQLFVFSKDKLADVMTETQGGNAAVMEKILGYDPGTLKNKRLVGLEIPMDWKYQPWLPTGWERAANKNFRYGGYTSGGLPELRMQGVKIDDVKRIDLGIFK